MPALVYAHHEAEKSDVSELWEPAHEACSQAIAEIFDFRYGRHLGR